MNETELKNETRRLINENRFDEAITYIFDTYQTAHPTAANIQLYRDKVIYKLRTEFAGNTPQDKENAKLLVYAFMTIIGHSEGESAFNIILLLLHLLHKGLNTPVSDAIALIKLDKASNNLNN